MPRYFLHISLSSAYIHDHEGVELADDNAARERAIQDITEVWRVSIVKRQNAAMWCGLWWRAKTANCSASRSRKRRASLPIWTNSARLEHSAPN